MKKLEEENKLAQEKAAMETKEKILSKYNSLIVEGNYNTNELNTDIINELFFNIINNDLAQESGTLTVTSYTDNRGS
jgi:hypothetical protein